MNDDGAVVMGGLNRDGTEIMGKAGGREVGVTRPKRRLSR